MLHLVSDEPTSDLFTKLGDDREVICRKVLATLLVCDLEAPNRMIAQFNRHEENISDNLMQLLIDLKIIAELIAAVFTLCLAEVFGLACVEDTADNIV